ncbi:glycosyl transferase family 2 [Bifidobacterium actinocoloniiforme DSM 22766]|uniref:Glycosyl transferase family 2 n=1 Tax=Bifidobacterium actinocoloniiforme DSM 22766 TaxID=1437605 RepID=A0A086Z1Z2_9BIFI|nr:glycosyltransferase [Bifidobacterium actinocoloniiforme]AKV55633.1 glycosyl transferase family 2 [Bifidobacterium actinocoloniiforme DSM 22766]KFI40542.1 glycosyl transferase family 2 [Bifidobacterium actinocoloniiforme DSM 22766]
MDIQTGSATDGTQASLPFSLLMPVYAGDRADYVRKALLSNTVEQNLPPSQVVLVQDGPVGSGIAQLLDSLPAMLTEQFIAAGRADKQPELEIVRLPHNAGLAKALNQGLRHCGYDLVARADSDDISMPERFEAIVPLLTGSAGNRFDVVGSFIQEFSDEQDDPGQVRELPTGGAELEAFARLRSPLHHPSVAFRRSVVASVGGYPEGQGRFEDYLLWERMILAGARLCNVPLPLVLYRVDAGAYERRGGLPMFIDELRMQNRFRSDGFTTAPQFVRNVCIRALYRLLPTPVRTVGYRCLTGLRHALRPVRE